MKNNVWWVNNIHVQNYLALRGIYPIEEDEAGASAAYRRTPQFRKVLEEFQIEFYIFPNKLRG
jgi:hypothetical protein